MFSERSTSLSCGESAEIRHLEKNQKQVDDFGIPALSAIIFYRCFIQKSYWMIVVTIT
ncbi:hypothetical protein RV11_GL001626 [Enterococcus phoeniculicola]|nr:hypothetical protein RV11_GL001626 [Enterococcus phoeniculicola]